jgi:hypothetical protein
VVKHIIPNLIGDFLFTIISTMGTLNITHNDRRLDTMIGRVPIHIHRSRPCFEQYDIHLFHNMVNSFVNKNYRRNISEYNIEFNVDNGLIIINFVMRKSFDVHDFNEKLENILLLVNCERKPQLQTIYNMDYQFWDSNR